MNNVRPVSVAAAPLVGTDFVIVEKTSSTPANEIKPVNLNKGSVNSNKGSGNLNGSTTQKFPAWWKSCAIVGGGIVVFIGVAYLIVKLKNVQHQVDVQQQIILQQQSVMQNLLQQNNTLLQELMPKAWSLTIRPAS